MQNSCTIPMKFLHSKEGVNSTREAQSHGTEVYLKGPFLRGWLLGLIYLSKQLCASVIFGGRWRRVDFPFLLW
jgi:hypothetical protein